MSRPKPAPPWHPFNLDPDVPADSKGRLFCRCGVVEAHPRHTAPALPVVPEQAEVRHRYDHDEED